MHSDLQLSLLYCAGLITYFLNNLACATLFSWRDAPKTKNIRPTLLYMTTLAAFLGSRAEKSGSHTHADHVPF
jgi:hypothetical protein